MFLLTEHNTPYSLFRPLCPEIHCTPRYILKMFLLKMEVDTGASFSVISKSTYDQMLSSHDLKPTTVQLKTYTSESLPVFGQFIANVRYHAQESPLLTIVAGHDGPSLIGRNWLKCLRLDWNSILNIFESKLSQILEQHSQVFNEGLGTLKNFKAKLFIVDNAKPIFCKARFVPYSIRPLVENNLTSSLNNASSNQLYFLNGLLQ